MGASPHTPLLGMINGVVRGWILCGRQRLCEHVLTGKTIASIACRAERFHILSNRVCPPQERVQGWQISLSY